MSSNGESDTCPIKSPQSVEESAQEAAEMYLPGMAQLEAAERVVMLEDQRHLARADREKVRKLEAKRVFGMNDVSNVEEPEMGDLIVTGDIHVGSHDQAKVLEKLLNIPQSQIEPEPKEAKLPGWVKAAGVALLGAGLGAGMLVGVKVLEKREPSVPIPAAQQSDKWNEYDIQKWVPNPEVEE